MTDATPIQTVTQVTRLLESLDIPYMIGGSFASSVHGMGRHTRDADLVIDLAPSKVNALVHGLQKEFYVSREAIQEALRDHDVFNAIHLESTFKLDFFILGTSPFDREEFRRRDADQTVESGGAGLVFKTPEDTILRKLERYRTGGETSDQQWRDVLGVLAVCRSRLDNAYMPSGCVRHAQLPAEGWGCEGPRRRGGEPSRGRAAQQCGQGLVIAQSLVYIIHIMRHG